MSDFEGDNNLPSDMSDLEEAVTVLPPGHSRGAKTVTVLPPPDKYSEGASEIKSYVTTATNSDEGAEKCIVCESVKMRMKSLKFVILIIQRRPQ